jgi:hypothetical protein
MWSKKNEPVTWTCWLELSDLDQTTWAKWPGREAGLMNEWLGVAGWETGSFKVGRRVSVQIVRNMLESKDFFEVSLF